MIFNAQDADSKRGKDGYPILVADAGAGPSTSSTEPPPPTYEEATTTADPSSPSHTDFDAAFLSPDATLSRGASYASANTQLQNDKASFYAPSTSTTSSSAGPASASVSRSTSLATSQTSHTRSASTSKGKEKSPFPSSPSTPAEATLLPPPASAPESFLRPPPPGLPYDAFPPAVLHSRSTDLERDGFPLDPPACSCAPRPHPFVTHDVAEDDWARFLRAVQDAGGLNAVHPVLAEAAPVVATAGLFGVGLIATTALKIHMNSKRKSPVADVVDEWNRRFFHPRCMEVTLAQGGFTYTGPADLPPPDLVPSSRAPSSAHVRAYDDESDDEPDVPGVGRFNSTGGRRRRERPRRRRGRIEYTRDLKASAGENWRLIVCYRPPVL